VWAPQGVIGRWISAHQSADPARQQSRILVVRIESSPQGKARHRVRTTYVQICFPASIRGRVWVTPGEMQAVASGGGNSACRQLASGVPCLMSEPLF